jgi:hypothetical protein
MARPDSPEEIATLPSLARGLAPQGRVHPPREGLRGGSRGPDPPPVHERHSLSRPGLSPGLPPEGFPRLAPLRLPLYHRRGAAGRELRPRRATPREERRRLQRHPRVRNHPLQERGETRSFAIFRLKALTERFPQALELMLSLLSGADYGDAEKNRGHLRGAAQRRSLGRRPRRATPSPRRGRPPASARHRPSRSFGGARARSSSSLASKAKKERRWRIPSARYRARSSRERG